VVQDERRQAMQFIQRYNLKPFKMGEFLEWMKENEKALAENAAEGWTLLGTWFSVRGFGQHDCETRWEIEGYETLGSDFGNEQMRKLSLEWMEFTDQHRPGETYLVKSTSEVIVMEGA
jgi:hypothetical protein